MEIAKEYEKLYDHWYEEFQEINLTELDDKTFILYNKILKTVNNHHENNNNPLRYQIFNYYKENFNYIFDDLLRIRKLKIINSALALKDIIIQHVTEAEKMLYQNIVSSVKGFDKVRAISMYEEGDYQELVSETETEAIKTEKSESTDLKIEENEKESSELTTKRDKELIRFTLLRFLRKTPPLVGIDLLNYGPFEKEEIANIPSQNAKILILEKFAVKIEIS